MKPPLAIEHVAIRVPDVPDAVTFYRDVFGLAEITRSDDTVYLGCGRDGNFDLAVTRGDPGFDHFALRVPDTDAVDACTAELEAEGVPFGRADGVEPGQAEAVRFALPGGVPMEVVAVEESTYPHDEDVRFPERADRAPVALDHVNLSSPRIREDVEFLTDVVGLRLSEVVGTENDWNLAFARCGEQHHDVALGSVPATESVGVHHVAWKYTGIEHMKQVIDRITRAGIALERGLGRHHAGNNLYAYFRPPGGMRVEILAEMANVHTDDVRFVEEYERASVAWGDGAPDSFSETAAVTGTVDVE